MDNFISQTQKSGDGDGSLFPMHVAEGFTVAAVGDVITQHPESMRPELAPVIHLLKSTDITFGNFETTAFDKHSFQGRPQAGTRSSWLLATPNVPQDVRSMGFSIMSRANNHALDWGAEAMLETDRLLDQAGIVHAGTGTTRAGARQPGYLDTPKGRISLVATSSTFTPMSPAMSPLGMAPGRPGLNALRTKREVLVTAEQMEALRAIRDSMPEGILKPDSSKPKDEALELFEVNYRVSAKPGLRFSMNPVDVEEILKSIRQGKQTSDFLIASLHAHEPGPWSQTPPDFALKLAHAAIDEGADLFAGHGAHQLRGIEIYRGKPIFYSLGNFFFEEALQTPIVADSWEYFELDPKVLTEAEFGEERRKRLFKEDEYYESIIAVMQFEQGQVSEIRLHPVDLKSERYSERGVPRIASPQVSQTILNRIRKLSEPFGTVMEIKDKIGIIRISPDKTSGIACERRNQ
jgi:poly-gamma-glutamate synthesis protein (capsule biosynthesis protein)